ncbi:MAG: F0F1 ATP synthase subunit delta [Patescibacteria group bacterium]
MKINPKLKQELKSFLMNKIQKEQNRVTVISAYELSADEKKSLSGKKFSDLNWKEAIYQVDRSVIAGVIIKAGSKTIDLSLAGSLSKLSNTLYEID